MADKVADEVDTVKEVVEKVEEPVVESNAVESDSLNKSNENDEKACPYKGAAPAICSHLWDLPLWTGQCPVLGCQSRRKRSEKSHQRQVLDDPEAGREMEVDVQSQRSAPQNQYNRSQRTVRKKNKSNRLIETI